MKVSANYYSITPARFIAGTKGSYGMEKLEIAFSEEWKGLAKKVVFYPPESEPVGVVYGSAPVDIPIEVMRARGKSRCAVFGYKDEKKLVTVSGEIDVIGTLDDTDNTAILPTPDEMAQVLSLMQAAIDAAESVREDAANGVFDGRDGNRWHIGNALTGSSTSIPCEIEGAIANDFYLNTTTFDLYFAVEDSVWKYLGNIKGGSSGSSGSANIGVDTFEVDLDTGMLTMSVSDDYGAVIFELNTNGYLEVTINE